MNQKRSAAQRQTFFIDVASEPSAASAVTAAGGGGVGTGSARGAGLLGYAADITVEEEVVGAGDVQAARLDVIGSSVSCSHGLELALQHPRHNQGSQKANYK